MGKVVRGASLETRVDEKDPGPGPRRAEEWPVKMGSRVEFKVPAEEETKRKVVRSLCHLGVMRCRLGTLNRMI